MKRSVPALPRCLAWLAFRRLCARALWSRGAPPLVSGLRPPPARLRVLPRCVPSRAPGLRPAALLTGEPWPRRNEAAGLRPRGPASRRTPPGLEQNKAVGRGSFKRSFGPPGPPPVCVACRRSGLVGGVASCRAAARGPSPRAVAGWRWCASGPRGLGNDNGPRALKRAGAVGPRARTLPALRPSRGARPLAGRAGDQRPSGARRRNPPCVHTSTHLRLHIQPYANPE